MSDKHKQSQFICKVAFIIIYTFGKLEGTHRVRTHTNLTLTVPFQPQIQVTSRISQGHSYTKFEKHLGY